MHKQVRADLALLMVAMFWGVSYYLIDVALAEIEPFTLNAYRFLGAFAIAVIFSFPKLKSVSKSTLKYSALVGVALLFTYIGATFSVLHTSLSNAGFLCALTVVITPIIAFFFKGVKPGKKTIVVLLLCLVGIGLLSVTNSFTIAVGDLLAIMCAIAYAIDLLIVETAVSKEDVDPYHLGVFQLGFTGLFCLIMALVTEDVVLPSSPGVWGSVIFLAVFCTGVAFIAQVMAQQYTTATRVGIIFTTEPVFAGAIAFFLAGEILEPRAYIGAVILVSSLFIMEIDFGKLGKKKKKKLN